MTTEVMTLDESPPMVVALGVSHRDVGMAESWLKWASWLCSQENGSQAGTVLVVSGTRRISAEEWAMLRAAIIKSDGMFTVEGHVLSDIHENGYPGSASHLFIRTLEHCNEAHPGSPVLWVETDTVPMRPGWFTEIEAEYAACGKPFLGYLEAVTRMPHMAGVAVYPPNWKELSPKLASVLDAPDDKAWGPGKGQAFDIYAAGETVPLMARAKTIQQIWRPAPFNTAGLKLIKPETALFHQCKDSKLISVLASARYPGFVEYIKRPASVFALRGHHHKAVIGHEFFPVAHRVMRLRGGWWSIIKPRSTGEAIKLANLCEAGTLEEVTEEDLTEEQRKRRKNTGIQHV